MGVHFVFILCKIKKIQRKRKAGSVNRPFCIQFVFLIAVELK